MNKYLKLRAYIISKYQVEKSKLSRFLEENPDLIEFYENIEYINIGRKKFRQWIKEHKTSRSYNDLANKAFEAEFETKISIAEIKRIEAEREAIELKKIRDELIDHRHAENYYLAYCKKINRKVFSLDKKYIRFWKEKLQQKLSADDLHDMLTEFKKFYERSMGAMLKEVKDEQKKEVLKWKK